MTHAADAGLFDPALLRTSDARFDVQTFPQRVRMTFNGNVWPSLATVDVAVTNLTTGATLPASVLGLAYDFDANALDVQFSGFSGGLPDGEYAFVLPASSVADDAGQPLAHDVRVDFHVLAGDANRDRRVDFSDLVTLAQNYGQPGRTFGQGNFDYSSDGRVTFADLVLLAQNYGTRFSATLIAPPKPAGDPARKRRGPGLNW